ncbi:MAG: CRISPR-associated exonuclease Cas4 [Clostridia bacterium]|nr:CRISPR-associated exonuclease Cas4 [Clostridia bacterium]
MNTKTYDDEGLLLLSGIQHFAFCERQWALIHIENQWAENVRTVEGRHLHERVDDPYFTETRNNVKVVRSVPLVSRRLGLYGMADLIEYHRTSERNLSPEIRIVEYKRGKPKPDDRDEVQLCAQAMCLEEMLGIRLEYGYFFYGETRHRHRVDFNKNLREKVVQLSERMHELFEKGITPAAVKGKKCRNCSLAHLCMPVLGKKRNQATSYIKKLIMEMEEETAGD